MSASFVDCSVILRGGSVCAGCNAVCFLYIVDVRGIHELLIAVWIFILPTGTYSSGVCLQRVNILSEVEAFVNRNLS